MSPHPYPVKRTDFIDAPPYLGKAQIEVLGL